MQGSYYNIPKAIFYLIRGDYILDRSLVRFFMTTPLRGITQKMGLPASGNLACVGKAWREMDPYSNAQMLGGSWGSKWVNNGDSWGYYIVYRNS